jgi:hypothetical protein
MMFGTTIVHGEIYNRSYKPFRGLDPEKAMQIKDINVLGVNLTMTMGKILSTLEKQGIKLDCRGIICQVRTQEFNIAIQYGLKSKSREPVTLNLEALPIAISWGQHSGGPANCTPARKAWKIFCSDGTNKHCYKNNRGQISAPFSATGYSSDGYRYGGSFSLKEPQQCGIRLEQHPKVGD